MPIDFSAERWDQLKADTAEWWKGNLRRPLIQAATRRDPGRPAPDLPSHGVLTYYDPSIPADRVIDLMDYRLSSCTYLSDAFPFMHMNMGPGIMAACFGAGVRNAPETGTVWIGVPEPVPLEQLSFREPDLSTPWFRRIRELSQAAVRRWGNQVVIGTPSMWGNLDLAAVFRSTENLLIDLYDSPDEVQRLIREGHEAWWRVFRQVSGWSRPGNPGYSCWTGIFCEEPWFMLQCDFCAMISPEMFDEFVKPELQECCRKLTRSFYHMDGPGQLPHLDSLLSIPELDGVQWLPGAGQPDCDQWPEVYRKIRAAGKKVQMFGSLATLDAVASQVGSAEGMVLMAGKCTHDEVSSFLRKWS